MTHAARAPRWRRYRIRLIPPPRPGELGRLRRMAAGLRELHAPKRIYEECGHQHTEEDIEQGRAVDLWDGIGCEETFLYEICAHCCTDAEGIQLEECAAGDDWHKHGPGKPVCPTAAILAGTP